MIVSFQWSYNVVRGLILTKIKIYIALFKGPRKLAGNEAPCHGRLFPKSSDQNFKIAILFSLVKKSIIYVFEDDLI